MATTTPQSVQPFSAFPINVFLGDAFSQALGRLVPPPEDKGKEKDEKKKEDEGPVDLGEMKAQWQKLKTGHQNDVEKIVSKVMAENKTLKEKNEKQTTELAVYQSAIKETLAELAKMTKERDTLVKEKNANPFAVAILEFEADLFAPSQFYRENSAVLTAKEIRTRLRALLPPDLDQPATFMVFVFLTRKHELLPDLISEGIFKSMDEFDNWILEFNQAHPLYQIIETDCSPAVALQRQRAFAAVLCRMPQCRRMIVGRWALDSAFMELVAPTPKKKAQEDKPKEEEEVKDKGKGKAAKLPDNLVFCEPYRTTFISADVRKRQPKLCRLTGLTRELPLRRGLAMYGRPVIDFSVPLYAQRPPLCLDYYLAHNKCATECCPFSHQYDIPPVAVEAMRFDLSRTPCPRVNQGKPCPFGDKCYFGHACPQGRECYVVNEECDFGEHMHPPLTPAPTPSPIPIPPPVPQQQGKPKPPPQQQQSKPKPPPLPATPAPLPTAPTFPTQPLTSPPRPRPSPKMQTPVPQPIVFSPSYIPFQTPPPPRPSLSAETRNEKTSTPLPEPPLFPTMDPLIVVPPHAPEPDLPPAEIVQDEIVLPSKEEMPSARPILPDVLFDPSTIPEPSLSSALNLQPLPQTKKSKKEKKGTSASNSAESKTTGSAIGVVAPASVPAQPTPNVNPTPAPVPVSLVTPHISSLTRISPKISAISPSHIQSKSPSAHKDETLKLIDEILKPQPSSAPQQSVPPHPSPHQFSPRRVNSVRSVFSAPEIFKSPSSPLFYSHPPMTDPLRPAEMQYIQEQMDAAEMYGYEHDPYGAYVDEHGQIHYPEEPLFEHDHKRVQ